MRTRRQQQQQQQHEQQSNTAVLSVTPLQLNGQVSSYTVDRPRPNEGEDGKCGRRMNDVVVLDCLKITLVLSSRVFTGTYRSVSAIIAPRGERGRHLWPSWLVRKIAKRKNLLRVVKV